MVGKISDGRMIEIDGGREGDPTRHDQRGWSLAAPETRRELPARPGRLGARTTSRTTTTMRSRKGEEGDEREERESSDRGDRGQRERWAKGKIAIMPIDQIGTILTIGEGGNEERMVQQVREYNMGERDPIGQLTEGDYNSNRRGDDQALVEGAPLRILRSMRKTILTMRGVSATGTRHGTTIKWSSSTSAGCDGVGSDRDEKRSGNELKEKECRARKRRR